MSYHMDFNSLVQANVSVEQQRIAENTQRTYNSLLRSYENTMNQIPNAPESYPITENKLRAFLKFYRSQHPQTTYSYLKSFVSAVVSYLRKNNLDDFTKTNNFKSYMLGLKRIMKGDTSPNAKKYVTIRLMIRLAKSTNQNVKNEIELMTIESLCIYGFLRISEACRFFIYIT